MKKIQRAEPKEIIRFGAPAGFSVHYLITSKERYRKPRCFSDAEICFYSKQMNNGGSYFSFIHAYIHRGFMLSHKSQENENPAEKSFQQTFQRKQRLIAQGIYETI